MQLISLKSLKEQENTQVFTRVEKELEYLTNHNMLNELDALKEVCNQLKEKGITYFCSGPTASLYTLFEMGITKINPLDQEDFVIPFEVFANQYHNNQNPLVYISVSPDNYEEALEILKEKLSELSSDTEEVEGIGTKGSLGNIEYRIGHVVLQKHPLVPINNPQTTYSLPFIDNPLMVKQELRKHSQKKSKSEAIKLWGLSHATYDETTLDNLFENNIELEDIPVFYDEVYSEALAWGYSIPEALEISYKAHYGTLDDQDLELAPTYIRYWLPKVSYMFPKSHALELYECVTSGQEEACECVGQRKIVIM